MLLLLQKLNKLYKETIIIYIMASPITFIANFINEYKKTNTEIIIEDFTRELFKNSIMSKYY